MYADIWEALADTIGDAPAVTHGARELTWSRWENRSARLAAFLAANGVGRDDRVALYLHNSPEYLEAHFACFKSRSVPVNVNFRYRPDELAHVLLDADARAVVYDATLAPVVADVVERVPGIRALIEVDTLGEPTASASVGGAVAYEEALTADPAPRIGRDRDDLYMIYTGGTTGVPKGVVYSMGSFTDWLGGVAAMTLGVTPFDSVDDVVSAVSAVEPDRIPRSLPVCPLMHGTGIWLGAVVPLTCGGVVHLLRSHSFEAAEAWRVVAEKGANRIVLVGDSFARPLLRELAAARERGEPYDTTSLAAVISSGAMLSAEVSRDFIEAVPGLVVLDVLGASEGGIGSAVAAAGAPRRAGEFTPLEGTRVFDDTDTPLEPGSDQIGWVGRSGPDVPLRYHNDPEKSARTFRTIDGVRYAFAGDLATVGADGSITLLGRGSNVINTGGEKVFAEEVEETLKSHPAVDDALVVGMADDRFGETVAAVLARSPTAGAAMSDDELVTLATSHVHGRLAGFKTPRRVLVVDRVPRAANGKADYATVRALLEPTGDSE
ncbi:MAG: AMP-binding protein [Acidimicrobiales bacterium]